MLSRLLHPFRQVEDSSVPVQFRRNDRRASMKQMSWKGDSIERQKFVDDIVSDPGPDSHKFNPDPNIYRIVPETYPRSFSRRARGLPRFPCWV